MDNTKKIFRDIKADGMLTSASDLRRYLTGFPSSFGFVYTDAQESIFFTDPRYAEAAKAALQNEYISVSVAKTTDSVLDYIKSKKVRRLAVPLDRLTVSEQENLLRHRFKLIDSSPVFIQAMSVKNEEEIKCIRRACEIAQAAYASLLGELREGLTENEVAGYLEYLMRKGGAEDRSFETIVAFGVNSSVPHHAAGQDKLKKGSPVLIDFGCKYGGYCSDMTRTIWFGGKPDEGFSAVYEAVYSAHEAVMQGVHPGITGRQADALARGFLARRNLDKFFTHSLGHGIGINIHEFPTLGPNSEAVLKDGMVFSNEPGVYFEGNFGIRIEDTVRLENGTVKSFMTTDKKLTVL